MFYMHGGKIYAPRNKNGKLTYDLMAVRESAGNTLCIVRAKGSAKALPSGALPMTESEVLARAPVESVHSGEEEVSEDVS